MKKTLQKIAVLLQGMLQSKNFLPSIQKPRRFIRKNPVKINFLLQFCNFIQFLRFFRVSFKF